MIVSLAGMVRLAHDASGVRRFLLGMVHSTMQLAGVAGVMIAASWLSSAYGLRGVWSLVAFLGLVGVVGGIGGMVGMSGYLWATNCLGLHGTEGYASLHHQDHKHFLRLHIEADGALTMYPIGIDRVARKWTLHPDAPAHEPWLAPTGFNPEPHLIENQSGSLADQIQKTPRLIQIIHRHHKTISWPSVHERNHALTGGSPG